MSNILFLHLSDIHCTINDQNQQLKIEKVVDSICTLDDINALVLIISGDLTNSGTIQEIKVIKHLIGKLLDFINKKINCGFVNVLIVPGNHDMTLTQKDRNFDDIKKWDKNRYLNDEKARLKNFFNYSVTKRCFVNDQVCDSRELLLDNNKIQINLLNSALFSTLENNDKELHFFPNYVAEKLIRKKDVILNISVIHHSYEWFEWDSKKCLKMHFIIMILYFTVMIILVKYNNQILMIQI